MLLQESEEDVSLHMDGGEPQTLDVEIEEAGLGMGVVDLPLRLRIQHSPHCLLNLCLPHINPPLQCQEMGELLQNNIHFVAFVHKVPEVLLAHLPVGLPIE